MLPTREEAGNVGAIARGSTSVLPDVPMEVIFVDDSDDDTPEAIRAIESRRAGPAAPPTRRGARPAVSAAPWSQGMRVRAAQWVCVMDADLQHPPEVLEDMLIQAAGNGVRRWSSQAGSARAGASGPPARAEGAVARVVAHGATTLFPRACGT